MRPTRTTRSSFPVECPQQRLALISNVNQRHLLGTPANASQPGNLNHDQAGKAPSGGSARGTLGLALGQGGILDFVLTSDLDWASEDCIAVFLEIAERFAIKPTIFVTHESPAIRRAAAAGIVELGIHPNFLPGSDHGADAGSVID